MALYLPEREHRILDHVARYRLSTVEVIHRLYFKPENLSLGATHSTLARLRKDPTRAYLASQKLYGTGRAMYFHLTERGAAYLGVPPTIGHGFDDLHIRAHYLGRLLFSCGRIQRPKFSLSEFDAIWPGLLEPGSELRKRFYSDAYFLDEIRRHTATRPDPRRYGWGHVESHGEGARRRERDPCSLCSRSPLYSGGGVPDTSEAPTLPLPASRDAFARRGPRHPRRAASTPSAPRHRAIAGRPDRLTEHAP